MTLEELRFEITLLEDRRRRASFPQVVAVWAYIAAAIIVCLLIAIAFPHGGAPEWLLLLLAPAALGGWLGIGRLLDHWSLATDWTNQDRERLHDLKRELFSRGLQK